jgi:hypothetical protein
MLGASVVRRACVDARGSARVHSSVGSFAPVCSRSSARGGCVTPPAPFRTFVVPRRYSVARRFRFPKWLAAVGFPWSTGCSQRITWVRRAVAWTSGAKRNPSRCARSHHRERATNANDARDEVWIRCDGLDSVERVTDGNLEEGQRPLCPADRSPRFVSVTTASAVRPMRLA